MKNEIILYQANNEAIHLQVKIEEETVWLSQEQMATLFGRNRVAITQHIGNIFKEGELDKEVVCKDFLLTTQHGAIEGKTQSRKIKIYNLDVIISVGYRVKSKQGTQFRIWATKVLSEHLLKGYTVNKRIDRVEDKVDVLSDKINKIDLQLNTNLPPNQGVFFDGQIFDAYKLVSDIVRSAKKSIVLIDNYVDDTVLNLFSKKDKKVNCVIFTKTISKQLKQDTDKFNKQYPILKLKQFGKTHDRFLIIDQNEVYHIGASLKDLGKKWFAFTKMDKDSVTIINSISEML
ncbi:MAG: DNA-binding protein [Bacteroidetes bacterium]|nr:MAG: DNA-binding protein [Bacteroidota bacterium]